MFKKATELEWSDPAYVQGPFKPTRLDKLELPPGVTAADISQWVKEAIRPILEAELAKQRYAKALETMFRQKLIRRPPKTAPLSGRTSFGR